MYSWSPKDRLVPRAQYVLMKKSQVFFHSKINFSLFIERSIQVQVHKCCKKWLLIKFTQAASTKLSFIFMWPKWVIIIIFSINILRHFGQLTLLIGVVGVKGPTCSKWLTKKLMSFIFNAIVFFATVACITTNGGAFFRNYVVHVSYNDHIFWIFCPAYIYFLFLCYLWFISLLLSFNLFNV